MALERENEVPGLRELRKSRQTHVLSLATMACPSCDAPVSPGAGPLSPSDEAQCPFCAHRAPVRDFLTLGDPARPAVVEVRVVLA